MTAGHPGMVWMVGWEEFLAISWQRPTPRCKPRSVFNWVRIAPRAHARNNNVRSSRADDYGRTTETYPLYYVVKSII